MLHSCQPLDQQEDLPNIVWITSEDMNAFLGVYDFPQAYTPHLDQLAKEGTIYTHAFATAPVCSPSRSCLVTGVYATTLGTQHLRSQIEIPNSIVPFPKFLRDKGYYCSNNKKEDYNFSDTSIWDESSSNAHWRNRAEGQAFFSVFNFETTHQSRVFGTDSEFEERFGKMLPDSVRHHPDSIQIPSYHFDSPLIRKLWARYHDLITIMDAQVGEIITQLKDDGLYDNTIIFYYADHGTGMPRSKRAAYDSGLRIPLIIKAPPKWQEKLKLKPGSQCNDLVSFVDFAPTMLSILGIPIPDFMQGKAFLGADNTKNKYVFGHSDRVDEAFELSRTVRGTRYRYVRNYLPQLPLIQKNYYTDQSEVMQELYRLNALNPVLTDAQASMWQEKRLFEELYDTWEDPEETHNLIDEASLQEVLTEMRTAHIEWAERTYDSGLLPEGLMHRIGDHPNIYQAIRDSNFLPLKTLMNMYREVHKTTEAIPLIMKYTEHEHQLIRYWAISTLDYLGAEKSIFEHNSLDRSIYVRLASLEALSNRGSLTEDQLALLFSIINGENKMDRLYASRILELNLPKLSYVPEQLDIYMNANCPEENNNNYYQLYSCWALEEGLKTIN